MRQPELLFSMGDWDLQADKNGVPNREWRSWQRSGTYARRCGVIRLRNSRDVMTLVFFQNLGKCRVFPVTR